MHDTAITISVGASRKDTHWAPRPLQWSELVARLSPAKLRRTPETADAYRAMTVAQRGEVKDVGGFVGGVVRGRRSNTTIRSRWLITLDADYATADLWPAFTALNLAGCVYSTHSHSPASPRLRLVVPLSASLTAEQYEPAARRVASWLGMDYFDDTTYQPARLMYWPSASADAEYVFESADAPVLDPATLLGTFDDWRDSSAWPRSSRQQDLPRRTGEKLPDPSLKPGWIGAFCRAYSVTEAISAFIPDVYTLSDCRDRYTYAGGSVPGGLVIYSDYNDADYAYSWHDTDPAGGGRPPCHAFDLVRIHRFGKLDTSPDLPIPDQPSFHAMQKLCEADEPTVLEYLAAQRDDFKEASDDPGDKPKPKRMGRSLKDVANEVFPPIKWAIGNLLPPGLAILAASPKFGKSWMALELCLCAGLGDPFLGHQPFKSAPCEALYLSLEDSYRRLNERLAALLRHHGGLSSAPELCDLVTSAPTLGTGLLTMLDEHMQAAPNTKLIIIDTLQKIRDGALSSKEGAYATDYREVGKLKSWADKYGVCVLLVHHLRKMADDDVMNRISGTNAVTGAADTLIVLSRNPKVDASTTMSVTGRDVEANEFKINFDKDAKRWYMMGAAQDVEKQTADQAYASDPVVLTLERLTQDTDTWSGTADEIAGAVLAQTGEYMSAVAAGRRINTLASQLAARSGIYMSRGSGRDRRQIILRKGDL